MHYQWHQTDTPNRNTNACGVTHGACMPPQHTSTRRHTCMPAIWLPSPARTCLTAAADRGQHTRNSATQPPVELAAGADGLGCACSGGGTAAPKAEAPCGHLSTSAGLTALKASARVCPAPQRLAAGMFKLGGGGLSLSVCVPLRVWPRWRLGGPPRTWLAGPAARGLGHICEEKRRPN